MPPSTRPRRGAAARATPQPASSPLSSPPTSPKRARPRGGGGGGGGGGSGAGKQSKSMPNGKKTHDLAPTSSLDSVLSTMQSNMTQTKADTARQRRVLASLDRRPPRAVTSPTAADGPAPKRAAKKKVPLRRAAKRRSDALHDDDDDTDGEDNTPPPPKTRRLSPVSSPPFPSSTLTPPPSTPFSATASGTLPPSQPPAFPVDDSDDDDDDDLEAALAKHQAAAERKAPSKSPEPDEPMFQPTQLPPGVAVGDTALLKVKTEWFPAKLQDFKPASEPGGKDMYVLVTEDDEEASCARHRVMFLCEEERLARASIGVCAEVKLRQRPRRSDDAATDDEYNAFRALQHEEQVGLLHDHLAEVVGETYAPSQWRIDAFFAGDAELGYAVDYGDFSPRDVEGRVLPAVTAWFARSCEGDEARDDTGDEPAPTRPKGSERIEALEEAMQRAFAQDVLLPETLIAICRRSFDLEKADTWIERPEGMAPGDAPDARADAPGDAAARTGDRLKLDVPAQGPEREYALARLKLDELMAYSAATQWERRKTEVQRARRFARAKLRLPDPAVTESKPLSDAAESRIEREKNEPMRLQLAFDRRNERRARRGGRS